MLLWPLQTHTSPKSTSLRVILPYFCELAVIMSGLVSMVGGRTTDLLHIPVASRSTDSKGRIT